MKTVTKFPLYIGLFVMTIAVVVSAVKLSDNRSSERAKAGSASSVLTLQFSSPDIVSLSVSSDQMVAGVDALIKFEKDKVDILPSSLKGVGGFTTSGGKLDEDNSAFSFSTVSRTGTKAGVIASFQVKPKNNSQLETTLQLDQTGGKTSVLSQTTGENITVSTSGVKLNLPAK